MKADNFKRFLKQGLMAHILETSCLLERIW